MFSAGISEKEMSSLPLGSRSLLLFINFVTTCETRSIMHRYRCEVFFAYFDRASESNENEFCNASYSVTFFSEAEAVRF